MLIARAGSYMARKNGNGGWFLWKNSYGPFYGAIWPR